MTFTFENSAENMIKIIFRIFDNNDIDNKKNS